MSSYLSLTRSHSYSLLFALPLLVCYEAGALYLAVAQGSDLRNGADVLLRTFLLVGGIGNTHALAAVLVAGALLLIVMERRRRAVPLRLPPFLGMVAESLAYASVLGLVVGAATRWLLEGLTTHLAAGGLTSLSLAEGIVLSLGAGLYEELVFRVLLVGGLMGVFRGSGLPAGRAALFAILLSSAIFSGFHYVGPYGDAFALPSFVFRLLAGLVFSALFIARGFGITAWTHALYDVLLVLALHAR
jgi:hypothetical protein